MLLADQLLRGEVSLAAPVSTFLPATLKVPARGAKQIMSVSNRWLLQRRPVHPGEMLREEFRPDYGLTVAGLAAVWALAYFRSTLMCYRQPRGNPHSVWILAQGAVRFSRRKRHHRAFNKRICTSRRLGSQVRRRR